MATPFRIKRSAVPGKAPAVSDLQLGELALNTYDAELYTLRSRPGIGTEVVKIGGAAVTNVLYVNKDGSDENTGFTAADAKATIRGAVGVGSTGTIIKVAAGTYVEQNPVKIPEQISIVGDSLREVTVIPQNSDQDLFHVSPGVLLSDMSFTGTMDPGMAVVAFDPDRIQYSSQSPYILNCTNFITNSIGMKIDGNHSIGPFKSFVTDSYTQYNQNGVGASITNEGYAQIVSLFTINSDTAVYTGTGGQCDITNSNSSFGNFGLVADGKGPLQYNGHVATAAQENADRFEIDLSVPRMSVSNAVYDNITGLTTITTYTDHGFSVGMGVTISGLGFTCSSFNYDHTFVSAADDSVNVDGGSELTPTNATYDPESGLMTLTVQNHGLTASNTGTATTSEYNPSTGILRINVVGNGLSNGDYIKIDQGALTFTCAKDNHATDHSYPRMSDPSFNKWLVVSNVDSVNHWFEVNVGKSVDTSEHHFKSSTTNGIRLGGSTLSLDTESIVFTCTKDGNTTQHPYPRSTDPAAGQTLGIESKTNDTFTINVGTATQATFPDNNGNVFSVSEVVDSKNFTVYVGPNRYVHTYINGGNVQINNIRPFDGKVIYFDDLYNSVGKIVMNNYGSGYTTPPTITISEPTVEWGVRATATATLIGEKVDQIEIISSGRGYSTVPTIEFSAPDVGINTATATIELSPTYYSIKNSSPVAASGICTITINENLPYSVGVGTTVPFYRQSRILASSHSFEYIGSGTDPVSSLPSRGGVPIQENEVDNRSGGLVIYTSTDQGGNFRIGEGVVIDQISGTISGNFYSKSLFANVTPLILALGGDQ